MKRSFKRIFTRQWNANVFFFSKNKNVNHSCQYILRSRYIKATQNVGRVTRAALYHILNDPKRIKIPREKEKKISPPTPSLNRISKVSLHSYPWNPSLPKFSMASMMATVELFLSTVYREPLKANKIKKESTGTFSRVASFALAPNPIGGRRTWHAFVLLLRGPYR